MLGAIVGDIVGSVYEWNNIKTKDFQLFSEYCFFTDDTVMTIAVAEAIMDGGKADNFIDSMIKWGRLYPYSGYGGKFGNWIHSDDHMPYNSWGNGSAMRVSPCAEFAARAFYPGDRPESIIDNALRLAEISASVTHNHPEGIKGAQATAYAMAISSGFSADIAKKHIREDIPKLYGYDLSKTCDEIRPNYRFNESCQDTVPQAIAAFLESTDFEDAIRNAISLGGDSDTLAAITGSIAEMAYGIPDWIKDKALGYLDKPLIEVYERWRQFLKFEG
ncbi:MAG: ADP-ribosylglycohydrolase family protein [Clostridiales bacterium]|jgi:ADP-ribosylglycohydrolase|nr:ADP-ribosylglycohydrolase family protein [Clostridiales bacterium]